MPNKSNSKSTNKIRYAVSNIEESMYYTELTEHIEKIVHKLPSDFMKDRAKDWYWLIESDPHPMAADPNGHELRAILVVDNRSLMKDNRTFYLYPAMFEYITHERVVELLVQIDYGKAGYSNSKSVGSK